jgi:hypothetical protein
MVRTRGFARFAALVLALLLLGCMAASALAVEHEVHVSANYGGVIEVAWPADVDFAAVTTLPYYSGYEPLDFTVTSSVAFTTTLTVTDYSTGGLALSNAPYVALIYFSDPAQRQWVALSDGQVLTGTEVNIAGEPVTGLLVHKELWLQVDPQPSATIPPITIQPGTLDVGLLFSVAQT